MACDSAARKTILTMKPTKNTTATDARISPSRRLLFFCSGVMAAIAFSQSTLVAVASSLGGVSKVWNGAGEDFPLQAFSAIPRPLGRFFALAAHGGQHDERKK